MSPEDALNAQILRYREMTCEQRLLTAVRLHDLACDMARLGIRRQNPGADETEIARLLRERLALASSM